MKKERNELFLVCTIVADRMRRKLMITERMRDELYKMNASSISMYLTYKKRYPDYEEVIIPNFKAMPLNIEI